MMGSTTRGKNAKQMMRISQDYVSKPVTSQIKTRKYGVLADRLRNMSRKSTRVIDFRIKNSKAKPSLLPQMQKS